MDSQNLWITLHEHHKLDDVSACWHGRKISVRRKIYKSQLRESSHASQPSWFQAAASNVAQWTAFKARRFKAALLCNEEKKKKENLWDVGCDLKAGRNGEKRDFVVQESPERRALSAGTKHAYLNWKDLAKLIWKSGNCERMV